MPPEFSVIIPTRGDSPHLRVALDSALGNRADLEVVVVHDRRPGEAALPDALVGDPRVRRLVSTAAGPGPASARNVGLDSATGRWVALLDDDDVWLPEHLGHARECLDRHPGAVLAAGDAYLFDDTSADGSGPVPRDVSALPRFDHGVDGEAIGFRSLLLANRILTPTVVLDRERLGPRERFSTDLRVMEDYDLWLRLARDHVLAFDRRPSVVVRRRPGSASRDLRAMAEEALEVLARAVGDGVPPETLTPGELRARQGRLWHDLAYACLATEDLPAGRRAAREAMARLPLDLRNYIYFLAGAVPTPLRRRWFGRGGRPASAGRDDGAASGPRGERSATVNGP